jgi:hypothetical protein
MQPRKVVFLIVVLLIGLSQYQSALAQSLTKDIARCNDFVVQRVGEHFKLSHFSYPRDGMYPSVDNGGLVVAGVCKPWPQNSRRIIAAFAYDAGVEYERELLLAIVDSRSGRVIASHKGVIPEDAAAEVTSSSMRLDTARYTLSKTSRAFGLRLNTFRDRCGYEGGFDDELTLYVVNNGTIKPVLKETLLQWRYGNANRCNEEKNPRTEANVSISVEVTSSNGLADLRLAARRTDRKRTVTAIVKYNGKHYDLQPWQKAFAAWWE